MFQTYPLLPKRTDTLRRAVGLKEFGSIKFLTFSFRCVILKI